MSVFDDPRPPGDDQGPPPPHPFYAAAFLQVGVLLLMMAWGILGGP